MVKEHERVMMYQGARGLLAALSVPEEKVYRAACLISQSNRAKFHDKPRSPKSINRSGNSDAPIAINRRRRYPYFPGHNL